MTTENGYSNSQLHWTNEKIYDWGTILNRIKFVNKNMQGLLPLYPKELSRLKIYAEKNDIDLQELISMRNQLKTQKEINRSRIYDKNVDRVKRGFSKLVDLIGSTPDWTEQYVRSYFKIMAMPTHLIIKTISTTDDFRKLSGEQIKQFYEIQADTISNSKESKIQSELFERSLENYIRNLGIKFKTESDIHREHGKDMEHYLTPDILFDDIVELIIDGDSYPIKWMDAKNYSLIKVPFILKSLHKQSKKYNRAFGPGAFIFHYGFEDDIQIPNTQILDGSKLEDMETMGQAGGFLVDSMHSKMWAHFRKLISSIY